MHRTGEQVSRQPVLWARGLTRSFGQVRALRGVDLNVERGERWIIFGPNGAGKTTLVGVLSTLLKPTGGELMVGGRPPGEDDLTLKKEIGMVTHKTFLYGDLTAFENLTFYGKLYGLGEVRERAVSMLHRVGLERWAHHRVRHFSRGMQQRLALARALLHSPSILLLDEPHTGLDPYAVRKLQELLLSLHTRHQTVVMTSHNLTLGLEAGTHVAILAAGRMVFTAPRGGVDLESFTETYFRCTGGENGPGEERR